MQNRGSHDHLRAKVVGPDADSTAFARQTWRSYCVPCPKPIHVKPNSCDLDLIENAFAELKAMLRSLRV